MSGRGGPQTEKIDRVVHELGRLDQRSSPNFFSIQLVSPAIDSRFPKNFHNEVFDVYVYFCNYDCSNLHSKRDRIFSFHRPAMPIVFCVPTNTLMCVLIPFDYLSNIVVVAFAALLNGKPDMVFSESQWKILAEILETIEKLRVAQYGGHAKEHNQAANQQRSRKGSFQTSIFDKNPGKNFFDQKFFNRNFFSNQ